MCAPPRLVAARAVLHRVVGERPGNAPGGAVGLVVDVPLNTAIADLDEILRQLLTRELARHHFEGVEVTFDAPSKEWSGKLTAPTVNLFLYDLREAVERADVSQDEQLVDGQAHSVPPPLRLELTFAVSAWTNAVEDEHRLLSQVLVTLFSYRQLPDDLGPANANGGGSRLGKTQTSVGRPREEKADFWTSVGGEYKASIDYVVHLTIASGARFTRGPEVRSRTLRTHVAGQRASTLEEMQAFAGTVRDAAGQPVAGAWVVLPDSGLWTATDADGRFRLGRVRSAQHRIVVRTADGDELVAQARVPGERVDLVLDAESRTRASRVAGKPGHKA
jgi:hypothetical protein